MPGALAGAPLDGSDCAYPAGHMCASSFLLCKAAAGPGASRVVARGARLPDRMVPGTAGLPGRVVLGASRLPSRVVTLPSLPDGVIPAGTGLLGRVALGPGRCTLIVVLAAKAEDALALWLLCCCAGRQRALTRCSLLPASETDKAIRKGRASLLEKSCVPMPSEFPATRKIFEEIDAR